VDRSSWPRLAIDHLNGEVRRADRAICAARHQPHPSKFVAEWEQRYWVHPPSVTAAAFGAAGVAIDCFTGQVIDKKIEVVNE
jgi:hypothetical protein